MRIITCSYKDEKILDDTVNNILKSYSSDEIKDIKFSTCVNAKNIYFSAIIIFK